jgi:hypothetical protein
MGDVISEGPVPVDFSSVVSQSEAVSLFRQHSPFVPSTNPTSVVLAEYTDATQPRFATGVPCWVVEYDNQAASPNLGNPSLIPSGNVGVWIGLVDAVTGQYLETEQFNAI